jgi:hypothetical protein
MASLHKAVEEDAPAESEAPKHPPTPIEHYPRGRVTISETEDAPMSRLSVIQDEKENIMQDPFENPPALFNARNESPVGTMKRLATLKVKKSWGSDGQRIITPSLRTSSANSLNQNRTASMPTVANLPIEEENICQVSTVRKHEKRGKVVGLNRGIMVEGIRGFFR